MSGGGGGGGVLREILARFGFEVDDSKLKHADGAVEGLIGKVKQFAGAIASGAFVHAMISLSERVSAQGKEIRNSALALGVSTDALQQWRMVAGEAGLDQGALAMGFGLLQRKALEATRGGAAAAMFKRLGVSVKDASGALKDPATLFEEVGFAIASMQNETERTGTALEFFGRSGKQFIPIFAQGREAVAAMRAELKETGAELSGEQLEALRIYEEQLHGISLVWEGFKYQLLFAVLPLFTRVATALKEAGLYVVHLTKDSHVAQVAMGALGAIALVAALKTAAAFAIPLLIIGGVVIAAAAVVLAIDDLIVTFQGGDTVTRRFVDGLFGIGATASAVRFVKQAVDDLAWGFAQAWATISAGGWNLFNTIVLWGLYIVAGPITGVVLGFYRIGAAIVGLVQLAASSFGGFQAMIVEAIIFPVKSAYNALLDLAGLLSSVTGWTGAGVGVRWTNPNAPASVTAGGGGGRGVQQRNQTNITINAGAAGAEEIGAEVERRISDAHTRHVDAALASMPGGIEGSGW